MPILIIGIFIDLSASILAICAHQMLVTEIGMYNSVIVCLVLGYSRNMLQHG